MSVDNKADADALEIFIDEGLRRGRALGYRPTVFLDMRERLKTQPAIKQLLKQGDIQSGFKRMVQLGLRDWTIEAAAIKFPSLFAKDIRAAAQWRLEQADKKPSAP